MVRGTRAVEIRGAVCQVQPFLLDLSLYTNEASTSDYTDGREFSVSQGCVCQGMRVKFRSSPVATVGLRLYRVSDEALLGARDGVAIEAGEMELFFAAPVGLAALELYRIGIYTSGLRPLLYYAAEDHPDGEVVTLTANCCVYHVGGDAYPNIEISAISWAVEPIVCA